MLPVPGRKLEATSSMMNAELCIQSVGPSHPRARARADFAGLVVGRHGRPCRLESPQAPGRPADRRPCFVAAAPAVHLIGRARLRPAPVARGFPWRETERTACQIKTEERGERR